MFPKQWSSYTGKERRFRHTSDVVLRFPEASLLGRIPRWGLFSQGGSIPARRNPPPGIIFPEWNHLCQKKSPARDYFSKADASCQEKSTAGDYFPELKASLPGEIPRWGLFFQGGIIPARRNPPPGIIFPRRMHPCSKNSTVRDYFPEAKASPRGRQAITG